MKLSIRLAAGAQWPVCSTGPVVLVASLVSFEEETVRRGSTHRCKYELPAKKGLFVDRQAEFLGKLRVGQPKKGNALVKRRLPRRGVASSKRLPGWQTDECLPFAPPELWYSPGQKRGGYRIIVQAPGSGFRHVVTPEQIRQRLERVPQRFLRSLEVIQLSEMTHKKRRFPCYGMQWGNSLYLYPVEESLIECFSSPPRPNLVNEVRMYGGRWVHDFPDTWQLVWSLKTINSYYLNNILIHELGHLVDSRNTSYVDRERYAEWFAIHYGYQGHVRCRDRRRWKVRRRHHSRTL